MAYGHCIIPALVSEQHIALRFLPANNHASNQTSRRTLRIQSSSTIPPENLQHHTNETQCDPTEPLQRRIASNLSQ